MPIDVYQIALLLLSIISLVVVTCSKRAVIRIVAMVLFCLICIVFTRLYVWKEVRYGRLASQGDVVALRKLGQAKMHYHHGARFDPTMGLIFLNRAAEAGDLGAQIILASHYLTGISAPADIGKARHWLQKAAEKGHPQVLKMVEKLSGNSIRTLEGSPEYRMALKYARGMPWSD